MRPELTALALTLAFLPGASALAASPAEAPGEISIDSARITGAVQVPPGPEYLHDAVFYQIYPQTFLDTNADGIGDLEGVVRKLDYVRSLGVDGFWINPFFASPFHDAGYDISDYYTVAPRYGTNDDARRMFAEAEKRGLKILFDWVISYTSIDHPWFQDSAKQERNEHSNWYIWTDNTWLNPPAAYRDAFIKGYGRRNGQFMRNFYWSQPALNFGFASPSEPWMLPVDHPDVLALQEELKRVLRFWMDMGADGFRADMAGALVKTEHVTGNDQFFTTRGEGTKVFWNKIRALMDEKYPGSFMVAEWSHPESALAGGGFHADFFHWFPGYNDLFQKESWRILNGYSEGHSFFDKEGKGSITSFLRTLPRPAPQDRRPGLHQPAARQPRPVAPEHRAHDRRPRDHLRLLAHHAGDPVHLPGQRDRHAAARRPAVRGGRVQAAGRRPQPDAVDGGAEPRLLRGRSGEALPARGPGRGRAQRGGAGEARPTRC